MIYALPTSLQVYEKQYEIRSDYRAVLDIILAINDEDLTDNEKMTVALEIFYPDHEEIPFEHCQEALRQCFWFINGGKHEDPNQTKSARLVDWEKDFRYIVSPVNRVLGFEIRAVEYLHWWTFIGAYMEIGGDCTFAQIIRIRNAKASGRALDKQDQEWYAKNRDLVDIKNTYTKEDNELLKKWGGG